MTEHHSKLNAKSAAILRLIAEGCSYEQILGADPQLTYADVFEAARRALDLIEGMSSAYAEKLARIRQSHPRAYEKWNEDEDRKLSELFRARQSVRAIAGQVQRQPSAVRSRLAKLNIVSLNERSK